MLVLEPPIAAVTELPTERDIAYALNIANRVDRNARVFMRPTSCRSGDDTIEQFEVITEFRRFVLAAEEELKEATG